MFNLFELLNSIWAQIGLGFIVNPALVIIIVIMLLVNLQSRKQAFLRSVAEGINKQRAALPATAGAVQWMKWYRKTWRGFWKTLFTISVYTFTTIYILWLWGIVFSGMPEFTENPFVSMHLAVQAIGQGMVNKPWLVMIIVFVFWADRAGNAIGRENGLRKGLFLQTSGGLPPAGTWGATWLARTFDRRLRRFVNVLVFFLATVYILWLWGVTL